METKGDMPLDNPRWEAYCMARTEGKSRREAMLEAYPKREKWKPESIDRAARRLEENALIKPRIENLQKSAAAAAVITRAEVIDGMAESFREAVGKEDKGFAKPGAVAKLGATLLDNLPEEMSPDDAEVPPADFGLLVAPPFLAPHRAVATDEGGDFWEYGGRFSGKSSHISLEIADGMRRHHDRSAYVVMRQRQDMRESVFEQMLWALSELGMGNWEPTVSPLKISNPATGQVVIFHGCDKADKTKAVKAPAGQYFAYVWFEEADQLRGMDEVRTVQQSVTRGPGPFFRFYGFNPPRSRDAWANEEIARREAAGLPVYRSSYLDMPPEWVPEQVRADAEALKAANFDAYRHEWLGESTGYGNEVFGNVEVRDVTDAERASIERHCYGVDWGFAADPWCWVMVGYVPDTRTLYVLDELSGHGLSNAETARMVRERMAKSAVGEGGEVVEDAEPYAMVACDSAEPKSVADYRTGGINAQGAPKTGPHNVRNSVRWLQDRSRIVVDPRCRLAASEFPRWKYETTSDGKVTGTVEDRDNHAIDAVRYACSTLISDRGCI